MSLVIDFSKLQVPKGFDFRKHILLLDPGHGGKDPGATSDGFIEKEINLVVTNVVKDILSKKGFTVFMTRSNDLGADKKMELPERTQMGKAVKAEFIISIHTNAGGGDGGELIHSIYKEGQGDELCESIADSMTKYTGQNIRRIFSRENENSKNTDYYGIINGARNRGYTGIIIEGFFIDNKTDRESFKTLEAQTNLGRAIAKGILDYYGFVEKENIVPVTPTIAQWKIDIYEEAFKNGLISEEEWKSKLDEPAPVWMVLSIANKLKGGK